MSGIISGGFARVDDDGNADPTNGATVTLWPDNAEFLAAVGGSYPIQGTAIPTAAVMLPTASITSGASYGGVGAWRFTGVAPGTYWIAQSYSTDDVIWKTRQVADDTMEFNVKTFGAVVDGVTDDHDAVEAAITAAKAVGGKVVIPDGVCIVATGLTGLQSSRGVTLEGTGGDSDAAHNAELRFTGAGAGAAIDARYSYNCRIQNLVVTSNNAAHTGRIIDLRGSVLSGYTQMGKVRDCSVFAYSRNPRVTASCIDIDQTIGMEISNNTLMNTIVGIQGGYTFCNSALVVRNSFQEIGTMPIRDTGEGWVVQGNIFQALFDTADPGSTGAPAAIDYTAGAASFKGLNIIGNWFGDTERGLPGTWIKLNAVEGVMITGNEFDFDQDAATAINGILFGEDATSGVVIQGNRFRRSGAGGTNPICINFAATTGHSGCFIGPNEVNANLDMTNGTVPEGSVVMDGASVSVVGPMDCSSTVDLNSTTGGLRLVAAAGNRVHGTSALATGAVTTTVNNTAVKTGATIIMLPTQAGFWPRDPYVSAIADSTSFTITHTNVASTPAFEYWIINPVA